MVVSSPLLRGWCGVSPNVKDLEMTCFSFFSLKKKIKPIKNYSVITGSNYVLVPECLTRLNI